MSRGFPKTDHDSDFLMERLERLREARAASISGSWRLSTTEGHEAEGSQLEQAGTLAGSDIVDQVDLLLRKGDVREREQWDEDDAP